MKTFEVFTKDYSKIIQAKDISGAIILMPSDEWDNIIAIIDVNYE